jgi:hypothetical protein
MHYITAPDLLTASPVLLSIFFLLAPDPSQRFFLPAHQEPTKTFQTYLANVGTYLTEDACREIWLPPSLVV